MTWDDPLIAPFFFTATAPPEIYTLSLHDALPISLKVEWHKGVGLARYFQKRAPSGGQRVLAWLLVPLVVAAAVRSEEHTSELQSQSNLVCRLLLEKKKRSSYSAAPVFVFSSPLR